MLVPDLVRAEAISAYIFARASGISTYSAAQISRDKVLRMIPHSPELSRNVSDSYHPYLSAIKNSGLPLSVDPLYHYLISGNEIKAFRVSSAQARGKAKMYAYWGVAEYSIVWSDKHAFPVSRALSRAPSSRRVRHLAESDADELAESSGGVVISSIGVLGFGDAAGAQTCVLESYYKQVIASQSFDPINKLYSSVAS